MENERPIEKLLRRFAKQRREEAGEPLDLHPATRRLLQGEVSRHFKQRRGNLEQPANWLATLWPKLVWAVPVMVIMGLGVWTVIRSEQQRSTNFELAKGESTDKDNLYERMAAPSMTANEPAPVATPNNELRQPASVEAESLAKGRLPVPASPARRVDGVDSFATSDTVRLAADETKKPERSLADSSRVPIPTATAVPTSARPTSTGPAIRAETDALAFNNAAPTPEPAKATALSAFAPAPAAQSRALGVAPLDMASTNQLKRAVGTPVLANFRVQQTGDQLRVIDADGSTYLGRILQTQSPQRYGARPDANDSALLQRGAGESAQRYFDAATQLNWNFRVSGTNRTRDELVVFSGNYAGPSNLIQDSRFQNVAQPLPTQLGTATASGGLLAPTQAILINGEVQIGGQTLEIRATQLSR